MALRDILEQIQPRRWKNSTIGALRKENQEDDRRKNDIPWPWPEAISVVRMTIPPKVIIDPMKSPTKSLWQSSLKYKNHFKACMEVTNVLQQSSNSEQEGVKLEALP